MRAKLCALGYLLKANINSVKLLARGLLPFLKFYYIKETLLCLRRWTKISPKRIFMVAPAARFSTMSMVWCMSVVKHIHKAATCSAGGKIVPITTPQDKLGDQTSDGAVELHQTRDVDAAIDWVFSVTISSTRTDTKCIQRGQHSDSFGRSLSSLAIQ